MQAAVADPPLLLSVIRGGHTVCRRLLRAALRKGWEKRARWREIHY
eukprot:gene15743-13489_t